MLSMFYPLLYALCALRFPLPSQGIKDFFILLKNLDQRIDNLPFIFFLISKEQLAIPSYKFGCYFDQLVFIFLTNRRPILSALEVPNWYLHSAEGRSCQNHNINNKLLNLKRVFPTLNEVLYSPGCIIAYPLYISYLLYLL